MPARGELRFRATRAGGGGAFIRRKQLCGPSAGFADLRMICSFGANRMTLRTSKANKVAGTRGLR